MALESCLLSISDYCIICSLDNVLPKELIHKGEVPRQSQISEKKKSSFTYFTYNWVLILSTKNEVYNLDELKNKYLLSPLKVKQIHKECISWRNFKLLTSHRASYCWVQACCHIFSNMLRSRNVILPVEMKTWSQLILKNPFGQKATVPASR